MELTLKVISGKHAGQKLRIPAPKFLIGRGDDCQLRPNSDMVSRHHCLLLIGSDGAIIRDLDSRNGTFVNEERIVGDRQLQAGDRLTVGHLHLEVRLKPTAEGSKVLDLKAAAEKVAADQGDDIDVLELFKDDPGIATRDTVRLDVSETITTRKEPLVDQPASAEASEQEPSTAKPRPTPLNSRPHNAKDGGEAAAEALRKFLKGR